MAIDFDGKKFDVDELKQKLRRNKDDSKWDLAFFQKYGKHLSDTDMKDP